PALHERDCEQTGFEWILSDDSENSVIAWLRKGEKEGDIAVIVSNFTPVPRQEYRIGVPYSGFYREALNTDAGIYNGSNTGNQGGVFADEIASHSRPFSLSLTLPPLSTIIFERRGRD